MMNVFLALISLQTSFAAFAAGTCPAESRSLVQTQEVHLPDVKGWKVTATNRVDQISCTARGKFPAIESATMIYDPAGKYRGGHWFLSIDGKYRLPANFKKPARLIAEGKIVFKGQVVVGPKGESFRAEFPALETAIQKLRSAKKVELRVDSTGWKSVEVPSLGMVIPSLLRCESEANGINKAKFWEKAEAQCG